MRALLIVNPHATSTTRPRRDVIVRALASAVDLEVVETRYRGEATRFAAAAASDKFDLVMTLGGDGTVNEAVNGLLGGVGTGDCTGTVAGVAARQGVISAASLGLAPYRAPVVGGPAGHAAPSPDELARATSGPALASLQAAERNRGNGAFDDVAASGVAAADGIAAAGSVPAGSVVAGSVAAGSVAASSVATADGGLAAANGNGTATDPWRAWMRPDAADLPALAALPGGNANVFTRSLQLPADPVDAAGRLIEDLASGKERCIGLGMANGRYFTFNAGVGLDAEVVRAVEGRRAHGRTLTPARYARTALRQYYQVTDRRHAVVTIAAPAGLCPDPVYLCIVSNSAPWTYLGRRPVNASPLAGFDTGLDLLALRSLGTLATMRTLRQMLAPRTDPLRGRTLACGHDLAEIELTSDRPVAFQLDGEYMGEVETVIFRSVPRALRVIGLGEG